MYRCTKLTKQEFVGRISESASFCEYEKKKKNGRYGQKFLLFSTFNAFYHRILEAIRSSNWK